MLANHTSISYLFERMLRQFGKLFDKKAFIANYQKQPVFADNLEEFESARDVVKLLTEEYRAAETPDYVGWASGTDDDAGAAVAAYGSADSAGGAAAASASSASVDTGSGAGGMGYGAATGDADFGIGAATDAASDDASGWADDA
jgi:hypothetical protein